MSKTHFTPAYDSRGVRVAPYSEDELFVLNYRSSNSEAYRALFEIRKERSRRAERAWQASLDALLDEE